MGGKASRDKGKLGERELAKVLRELCAANELDIPKEQIHRSQQFSGKSGDPDVRGLPGVHIECKRVESLNVHKAYRQAVEDHKPGTMPIVMHRMNKQAWMATLTLVDLMKLYSSAFREGGMRHGEDSNGSE